MESCKQKDKFIGALVTSKEGRHPVVCMQPEQKWQFSVFQKRGCTTAKLTRIDEKMTRGCLLRICPSGKDPITWNMLNATVHTADDI